MFDDKIQWWMLVVMRDVHSAFNLCNWQIPTKTLNIFTLSEILLYMLHGNSSNNLSIENIWHQELNCGSNDTSDAYNWPPFIFGVSFQIGWRYWVFLLEITILRRTVCCSSMWSKNFLNSQNCNHPKSLNNVVQSKKSKKKLFEITCWNISKAKSNV